MDRPAPFEGPSWLAAAGTGLGYAALLVLVTLVLFVLPFLAFRFLGTAG